MPIIKATTARTGLSTKSIKNSNMAIINTPYHKYESKATLHK